MEKNVDSEACFQPIREQILIALNFEKDLSCNIYQIGSRVYGTHRDDSDYDFFMVISDDFYQSLNENYSREENLRFHNKFKDSWVVFSENENNRPSLESKLNNEASEWSKEGKSGMGREFQCLLLETSCGTELNVNLYNYSSFKKRLESNWIQSIMCYSASEKFVPSLDFPELHTCFKLYFRKIALSAIAEASSHYRLAKKYWSSSNTYRPKKYIVHTFRDLLFAIQIVKFRRIVDFSQSNDLYYEIMGKEETDWNYFDSIYYARYQKMKEELNELVMLPPIVKEIEKLPNSIHVYVTRMNNDFQSISDELESYFSLDITHKNENNVEYLYFRGTDETPLYSDFTLKLFNGCILGKFNNVTELICLPHKKAIPVGNRYQPKVLDIKNGCTIWNIEASANIENLMVHIYYDIFTHNWKMLHNEKPSCEIIWKKFKELGYETPNNVDFTYTFEVILERKTFIIQQINLFSIQDTKKEVMVDFSEELYSTKRLKHNGLTSLTHITNYAKQINPLETKEILIIEKSCILSVSVIQLYR